MTAPSRSPSLFFFLMFPISPPPLRSLLLATGTLVSGVLCLLQSWPTGTNSLPCFRCSRIHPIGLFGPTLPRENSRLSLYILSSSLGGRTLILRLCGERAFRLNQKKKKIFVRLLDSNFQLVTKFLNAAATLTQLALFVERRKTLNTLSSNVPYPDLAGVVFDRG